MAVYSTENANIPAKEGPPKDFYASYRANKYNATPNNAERAISNSLPVHSAYTNYATAPAPSKTYSGAYSANVSAFGMPQNIIIDAEFDTEDLHKLPADPNRDWNKEFQVLYESPAATLLDREVYPPPTLTF